MAVFIALPEGSEFYFLKAALLVFVS